MEVFTESRESLPKREIELVQRTVVKNFRADGVYTIPSLLFLCFHSRWCCLDSL